MIRYLVAICLLVCLSVAGCDQGSIPGAAATKPKVQLVCFTAKWCGPCHQKKPGIDAIEKETSGKLEVIWIDVDEQPALAAQYGAPPIPLYLGVENEQVKFRANDPAQVRKLLGLK